MSTPIFTQERLSDLQFVGVANTANNTSTSSLVAQEAGITNERQTRLDFVNFAVVMTNQAGTFGGTGAQRIYTFPAGTYGIIRNIVVKLNATPGTGGITDTATLKYAIGTVAEATDDTLNSTQADILASTNATAFVGGLGGGGAGGGAMTGVTNTAVAVDARSAAVDAFLNFGIADIGINSSDTVTLNGCVYITWALLGT